MKNKPVQFGLSHVFWLMLLAAVLFKWYSGKLEEDRLKQIRWHRMVATLEAIESAPIPADVPLGMLTAAESQQLIGRRASVSLDTASATNP